MAILGGRKQFVNQGVGIGQDFIPGTAGVQYDVRPVDRFSDTPLALQPLPHLCLRASPLRHQPRELLRSLAPNFVEMTPNGKENYCCGGGGGLVSIDEIHDYRMDVAGKLKAEQIRNTGAEIVVAPCANCKKQLKELVAHYELPCVVTGLHDLVLRAIEIPGGKSPQQRAEEAESLAI